MLCALEEMRVMMKMEASEMLHKFDGVNRTNYQDKINMNLKRVNSVFFRERNLQFTLHSIHY